MDLANSPSKTGSLMKDFTRTTKNVDMEFSTGSTGRDTKAGGLMADKRVMAFLLINTKSLLEFGRKDKRLKFSNKKKRKEF